LAIASRPANAAATPLRSASAIHNATASHPPAHVRRHRAAGGRKTGRRAPSTHRKPSRVASRARSRGRA
jgi:hypothetical protein